MSISGNLNVLSLNGENDEITIEIVQDRNGHETTWQLVDDDNNIVASGGPYEYYFGQSSATELHTINVNVAADKCLKFTIYDLVGNGICCNVGDGYYRIIDGYGNVVVDGEGDFGYEASHNLYTMKFDAVAESKYEKMYKIYPNPTTDMFTIEGKSMKQIMIYNTMGQIVELINCNEDIVNINVESLPAGIYFVNMLDDNYSVVTKKISVEK